MKTRTRTEGRITSTWARDEHRLRRVDVAAHDHGIVVTVTDSLITARPDGSAEDVVHDAERSYGADDTESAQAYVAAVLSQARIDADFERHIAAQRRAHQQF